KAVIVDSTTVVDGKLTVQGIVDSPDLHYLGIDGLAGFMPIMVENEKMEVTLYKDSLQRSLVKRSKENDLLKIYHDDSEMLKMKNRSEEHTSELQSRENLVCRLLLEKKKKKKKQSTKRLVRDGRTGRRGRSTTS